MPCTNGVSGKGKGARDVEKGPGTSGVGVGRKPNDNTTVKYRSRLMRETFFFLVLKVP